MTVQRVVLGESLVVGPVLLPTDLCWPGTMLGLVNINNYIPGWIPIVYFYCGESQPQHGFLVKM